MQLTNLMELQAAGALKIDENCNASRIIVGGVQITPEQCRNICLMLGWTSWDKRDWEIIDKTNKFIKSLRANIDNEDAVAGVEVTFQNHRRTDTEKYYDRIKMVGPYYDITILYGMPGTGGAYAIYDASNHWKFPVYTCRTAKQVAEYINDLV